MSIIQDETHKDEKRDMLLRLLKEAQDLLDRAITECDGGGAALAQAELDTVLWDLEALDNE